MGGEAYHAMSATLPAGWREDAQFMLEFSNLGPYERMGIGNIVGQKSPLTTKQKAFLARTALQCFADSADYQPMAGITKR